MSRIIFTRQLHSPPPVVLLLSLNSAGAFLAIGYSMAGLGIRMPHFWGRSVTGQGTTRGRRLVGTQAIAKTMKTMAPPSVRERGCDMMFVFVAGPSAYFDDGGRSLKPVIRADGG